MSIKYLSYPLDRDLPVYGKRVRFSPDNLKSLSRGDSTNTYNFCIENHWGTHIDAPNHFFESGKRIIDYPAEFFCFKKPSVINVSLDPSETLNDTGWSASIERDAEIVLFKSGWGRFRKYLEYTEKNPGIHPDVAALMKKRFPALRAIGIDWISISSYTSRELGREAHRAFLGCEIGNTPILIIEDMDLSSELKQLKEVWALPLRIEGIDSAPCTVVGVFDD